MSSLISIRSITRFFLQLELEEARLINDLREQQVKLTSNIADHYQNGKVSRIFAIICIRLIQVSPKFWFNPNRDSVVKKTKLQQTQYIENAMKFGKKIESLNGGAEIVLSGGNHYMSQGDFVRFLDEYITELIKIIEED